MRNIYLIHKWLSLIFGLPLIVMAITGFVLAIAPKDQRPQVSQTLKPIEVSALLKQARVLFPKAQFMRAGFSEEQLTIMMKDGDVRLLKIDRASGNVLSNTKPTDDFFVLNKIIHESFLLQGPGKNFVALSGIALFLILISGTIFWMKNKFRREFKALFSVQSFKSIKKFHVFIGVLFLLPLLFASVSGTLIEWNNFFMSDNKPIAHERPLKCDWDDVLEVVQNHARGKGTIMFCRPDQPYLFISGQRGITQFTPDGKEVLFVPKDDWAGNRGTRKHWFVHWHGGENFGSFEFPYQLLSSLPLLILGITGFMIWMRKKRIIK